MIKKLTDTALTLGKIVLKSRWTGRSLRGKEGGRLIIMGNGPSLRETLKEKSGLLAASETMAVNFAANTDEFFKIRPSHYILADPHFFKNVVTDPNVVRLWDNLRNADWELTLHLPAGCNAEMPDHIRKQHFNMTPAEGFAPVCHFLYRKALAMPRPRNVLIPAIMEGIRDGYSEIYIVGADHTWPHSLYVDDFNRVVSEQPHFYKDNDKELSRVAKEYAGLHLHDVLGSMTVAFRSYHHIERYAVEKGVKIWNSTPVSLIDAFTRKPLP